jgi:hypothetical protein
LKKKGEIFLLLELNWNFLFPSFLQSYNIKAPILQPFAPSSRFEKIFVEALTPQTPCAKFQKLKKTKGVIPIWERE